MSGAAFQALRENSESVLAKATAQERLYKNSWRRALKARTSVGQMKDHALGKKIRISQWLAWV
jgi:hypothetical protein